MRAISRRQRERQQRVNYVLDVAERLFADRGFFKVTMSQLAQRAEFALGTIYSFFKGKRELYDKLIDRKMNEFVSFVSEAMAAETAPRQVVEQFTEAKLTFLHRNLNFVRLYFAHSHVSGVYIKQPLGNAVQGSYASVIQKLTDAFREGISKGIFADLDPAILTTALDGLTTGFAISCAGDRRVSSPVPYIEAAKRIFLKGALTRA